MYLLSTNDDNIYFIPIVINCNSSKQNEINHFENAKILHIHKFELVRNKVSKNGSHNIIQSRINNVQEWACSVDFENSENDQFI